MSTTETHLSIRERAVQAQREKAKADLQRSIDYRLQRVKNAKERAVQVAASRLDIESQVDDWKPISADDDTTIMVMLPVDGLELVHRYPSYHPNLHLRYACPRSGDGFEHTPTLTEQIQNLVELGQQIQDPKVDSCALCFQRDEEFGEAPEPKRKTITVIEGTPEYDLIVATKRMIYRHAPTNEI